MTTWTKTPPTEPGWYWVRKPERHENTFVFEWLDPYWYGVSGESLEHLDFARYYEFWPVRIEEPPVG